MAIDCAPARVPALLPDIRIRLSGITPPSLTETSIVPSDISGRFNMRNTVPVLGVNLAGMTTGTIQYNIVPFVLKRAADLNAVIVGMQGIGETGLSRAISGIPVSRGGR
jgi:hypothetical protein